MIHHGYAISRKQKTKFQSHVIRQCNNFIEQSFWLNARFRRARINYYQIIKYYLTVEFLVKKYFKNQNNPIPYKNQNILALTVATKVSHANINIATQTKRIYIVAHISFALTAIYKAFLHVLSRNVCTRYIYSSMHAFDKSLIRTEAI